MTEVKPTLMQRVLRQLSAPNGQETTIRQALAKDKTASEGARRKIAALTEELEAEQADVSRFNFEAPRQAVKLLGEQLATARAEEAEIVQRISNSEARLSELREEQERLAALDRLRAIPVLRRDRENLIEDVTHHARALGVGFRQLESNGRALSAATGSVEVSRVFSRAGLTERIQYGLWKNFELDQAQAGTASGYNFLPMRLNWAAPAARRSFAEMENAALDQLVRCYGTRAEAEKARLRLSNIGEAVEIVRDDTAMVFRLVRGRLAGKAELRARADAEAQAQAGAAPKDPAAT